MILEIALLLASLAFLYYYLMSRYNFWDTTCVPVLRPKYPIFGNMVDVLFSLKDVISIQKDIYNMFPNQRFVGLFTFGTPNLFVRDPAMIERIAIKDFAYASDRGIADDPRATKLSMHLINTRDDHWRSLRNKLTPTFSTGKLKGMHGQLLDCADSLVKHMKSFEAGRPFEARDVTARFTTDVIASCAFGLNIDSINDPKSMFREFGKAMFTFSPSRKIATALRRLAGPLSCYIKVPGEMTQELIDFFINAVKETLEYRKQNGIVRPDFLHLMNELFEKDLDQVRRGQLDPQDPNIFDEVTLVSNAFVFFTAGFETTATTISYVLYELALHEEIQERAYQEILEVSKKHNGELTFEAFHEMKYLDQVIAETQRLRPAIAVLVRKITKEYPVPETNVVMPVGSFVTFPLAALYQDPALFPQPFEFNPNRFSEENEINIVKGAYLPFGIGPRMCIGTRFAKLTMKVALANMILKYKLVTCSQTQIPLTYDKAHYVTTAPEQGIWLGVQSRGTAAA